MNRFNLILVLLCIFTLSCTAQQKHHLSFKDSTELQEFLDTRKTNFPILSAHRGGPMKGFPENAIETFENATRYQPVIIEFDVALSKDSALVIMHDDKLDRTTTGTGMVSDYTYKELQALNLKDDDGQVTDFKIPTLKEVLQWGKGKVLFTVDIKRGVPYEKVIEAIRLTKAENCVIVITYNAGQAAAFHRLAPDLMISATVKGKEDLERLNQMGVPTNRIVAFVGVSAPDKAVYELLAANGITAILGTMGNLDKSAAANPSKRVFYHLVKDGASVLSTDDIVGAGKELTEYRQENGLQTRFLTISK
ncbi:glycerophosphodiester phosphodiesterase family protein [Pedobacter sp.]|uniref:glycerophosphodiester phosphodiesterase family protein n=1 Tax=Pedobacter sp. TaxID=1411316 RepID=UPI003D7FDC30